MMNPSLPPPATAIKPKLGWLPLEAWKRRQTAQKNASGRPKSESESFEERHIHLPESGHETPVDITEADVLEEACINKSYRMPSIASDIEVTDLPSLDDVTRYEVSEDEQKKLWSLEISRLVKVVTTNSPLEFQGSKNLDVDSKKSYEILADLADRLWQAINIAIHDSENGLVEHAKSSCRPDRLKESRVVLDYLCNRDDDGANSKEEEPRVHQEDFFNFINYITATFARVLCAAGDGKSMRAKALANLAKIATKLKVVSAKLREFSQISIDNGVAEHRIPAPSQNDPRGRHDDNSVDQTSESTQQEQEADPFQALRGLQAKSSGELMQLGSTSKKDSIKRLYLVQCANSHLCIFALFRAVISSLRGNNNLMRTSLTSYEICAMIYETGFERFRTLVFQDHNNDFLGTSDPSYVNCARSVFHVLDQAVRRVSTQVDQTRARRNDNDTKSVGTKIYWNYVPKERGSECLKDPEYTPLRSMSQVITVIIPLVMANPFAVNYVERFVDAAIFTQLAGERHHHPIKPRAYSKYTALFCLTTEEYDAEQRRRASHQPKSLSNALMGQNNLLAGRQIAEIGRTASFARGRSYVSQTSPDKDSWGLIQRHQSEMDQVSKIMKEWVFEEKGVKVQCRAYVVTLVLLCVSLVIGGVSIGVSVGERISGVDPFNITTYCWVFAAFLLLVAKSIRVQNWPWNDFLHGRVLCKSVSELSSVTGIREQLILAKLLQDESTSFLQTRGPFNLVFKRKSDDGFSIDSPLSTWTMLLSGLIMIEVETARGHGLVCLDLRRGTGMNHIKNLGEFRTNNEAKTIHCNRLMDENDPETYGNRNKIRLDEGHMVWLRALGFHSNKNAEFI